MHRVRLDYHEVSRTQCVCVRVYVEGWPLLFLGLLYIIIIIFRGGGGGGGGLREGVNARYVNDGSIPLGFH